jgi:hypothetical protein
MRPARISFLSRSDTASTTLERATGAMAASVSAASVGEDVVCGGVFFIESSGG